jgi:hypothetical protein
LQLNTGFKIQSEASPVAWLVEDPSNPQIGNALVPFSMIFVFDRKVGVGSTPSIQMYSA